LELESQLISRHGKAHLGGLFHAMSSPALFPYSFNILLPVSFLSHSVLSGILFSFFLGAATPLSELYWVKWHRYEIYLVMIGSDLLDHTIDRSDPPDLLSELLESRLGVYKKGLFENMRQCRVDMREDELSGPIESLIQIECSDDRLERIGEDVRILMSLRIVLTTRDLYRMREVKLMSNLSQIASSDKCWADIGEFSLWFLRKCMIECLCNDELEDGIPEILESLVGLTISICDLIEDRSMDTSERIEIRIFRQYLERSE
jgi:hypothetical protein